MAESLGTRLRQKREALNLSLEDVEGRICIRAKHLQAIESDDLSQLASSAQAKGFIRTYALFLDVPFEPATHPVGATRPSATAPAVFFAPPEEPAPKRKVAYDGMPKPVTGPQRAVARWFRMEVMVMIVAGLMVLGLFAWGVNSMVNSTFTTPTATATQAVTTTPTISNYSVSQTMLAATSSSASVTPTAAPTNIPGIVATPRPTLFPTPPGGVYATVHIRILVLQSAYLKVDVDDATVFAQRVLDGDAFEFDGKRIIAVTTGNGAALRIYYNGIDQGIMGNFGDVIIRAWNLKGLVQVTSTPIPTTAVTPSDTPSQTPAR